MPRRKPISRSGDNRTHVVENSARVDHDSWDTTELIKHLDKVLDAHDKNRWSISTMDGTEWCGGMTARETLHALKNGWNNAPKVESIEVPGVRKQADEETFRYDVTGEILDIGAFCSGEPEHWLYSYLETVSRVKVAKVTIEVAASGNVSALAFATRGKAIIAMIHALELAGYSLEVELVCAIRPIGNNLTYVQHLRIKAAGEPLNMNKLQLMIGCVAFYRQLLFAMWNYRWGQELTGTRMMCSTFRPADADIYMHTNTASTENLDEAIREVKELINTLVNEGN